MLDLIFVIIYSILVFICYHIALRTHVNRAYWRGYWEGHGVATENAVIEKRLREIEELND